MQALNMEKTMITKEELLSMPAADYMAVEQLAYFHSILAQRLNEQSLRLRSLRQDMTAFATAAQSDQFDAATVEEERRLVMADIARTTNSISSVQAALNRIKDNSFGYCESTGEEIGVNRLLANPEASLSIYAMEVAEHRRMAMKRSA